jgi:hypothetical protein
MRRSLSMSALPPRRNALALFRVGDLELRNAGRNGGLGIRRLDPAEVDRGLALDG